MPSIDFTSITNALSLAETYADDGAPVSARANLLRARALIDTALHPDKMAGIFLPGRQYVLGDGYTAPEETLIFLVEHVMYHPERKIFRAVGWEKTGAPDARWHGQFHDEDEGDEWKPYAEPDECTCVINCAEDPRSGCSLSGRRHVHPLTRGQYGQCPEHPDAEGDL
ncbi:hypothetical protein [Streptomyces sp. BH055]|uniref:hypothetical protein n=1 Tax=unclassified Streptomyces TaxID=2593676 RepID=UPI003BB6DB91